MIMLICLVKTIKPGWKPGFYCLPQAADLGKDELLIEQYHSKPYTHLGLVGEAGQTGFNYTGLS